MNIIELDPYNDMQLEKIKSFEETKGMDKLSKEISRIRNSSSKEEYYDSDKNEFEKIIFTEKDNKITDCCYIYGEKDIKQCRITPISSDRGRELTIEATNYALDNLGMEEVFIPVDKDDNSMIAYLELREYENIGEVEGNILLLKEKKEKESSLGMIS